MCVCVCVFIQGFFPGRGKDFERELLLTQVHYYISRFLFNLPTKYWTNCYCMNKNSEYLREGGNQAWAGGIPIHTGVHYVT